MICDSLKTHFEFPGLIKLGSRHTLRLRSHTDTEPNDFRPGLTSSFQHGIENHPNKRTSIDFCRSC